MNNTDHHPRILSLSSYTSTSPSTPTSSSPATPTTQSRRASHDSAHDAHHFIKRESKANASLKKLWKDIKAHAMEHHKSVNAAYAASYGAGMRPMGH